MSGVKLGGRESDLTIPYSGVRFGHYDSTLTHRLLKVTFWRRARLSIGRKTLPSSTAPEYYHSTQEHSE